MVLPVNIDLIYGDDSSDPSVKVHQQHHDEIHSILVNTGIVTYTPTIAGITLGTGSANTAQYSYIGGIGTGATGILSISGLITLGTGFSFGSPQTITLPSAFIIPSTFYTTSDPLGILTYRPAGSSRQGGLFRNSNTAFVHLPDQVSGANIVHGSLWASATVPGTWVAGNTISWSATIMVERT